MQPLLGTFVEIGVGARGAAAHSAIDEAFDAISKTHRALSFQDPASELSAINRQPGAWVAVGPLCQQVLRLARAIGLASGDSFNCTVGGQMVEWGVLPDPRSGSRLLRGRSTDIELLPGAVRLRRPVLVTLDGIAKGYAVDRALARLRARQIPFGWVNAGGDIGVCGDRGLQVSIREADGRLRPPFRLQNGAVASSCAGGNGAGGSPGCIAGAATCHSPGEVISILAQTAWRADALTKVAAASPAAERGVIVSRLGGKLIPRESAPCNA